MKRIVIITGVITVFITFCSFLALHTWIRHDVKQNIRIAQQKYAGSAEDALIAFLEDEGNSYSARSHTAIWTLGQIRSKKALPLLYNYYKNDPEGETCKGQHGTMFCQRELHKAIRAIENKQLFTHARLNK